MLNLVRTCCVDSEVAHAIVIYDTLWFLMGLDGSAWVGKLRRWEISAIVWM